MSNPDSSQFSYRQENALVTGYCFYPQQWDRITRHVNKVCHTNLSKQDVSAHW